MTPAAVPTFARHADPECGTTSANLAGRRAVLQNWPTLVSERSKDSACGTPAVQTTVFYGAD